LKTGESGIALSISVVTIIVNVGVNESAAVRSNVSGAGTTTSSLSSASSGRSSAEIIEFGVGRSAGSREESAALTLTEIVRISVAVVRDVPASTFEHGEGELTERLLVNQTGSHGLEGEESSFEMGTSGSGTSTVFHVSTLHSAATKELSDSASQRSNINDLGGLSTDGTSLDVTSQNLAAGAQEVLVETRAETESVGQFVHDHVDVLFVQKNVGAGVHKDSAVKQSLGDQGSL